jgi:hypothetical protein
VVFKNKMMDTITLGYDANNTVAQKTIKYILSTGLFKEKKHLSGLDEAMDDLKQGRINYAKDAEDLIKQCRN